MLSQTPDMLPALKKAGVVDAGGMGLLIIFKAMRDVFDGGAIAVPAEAVAAESASSDSFKTAVSEFDEEINFTYCTEFIVQKSPSCPDPFKLRAYLETIGDCVVVVDDEKIIKVHVHTDNPGLVLQKALEFGHFINDPKPKIENMRIQHENKVREAQDADAGFTPAEPEKDFGFVAVAAGHGLEAMFTDLGADIVVKGGQTMNPSTEDILRAILSTPARTVFVLPNNKNIIMAAEQAVKLTDRTVCVLQTRTIPQGISAMLAFDDSLSLAENRIAMTKAFEKVSTGLITFAARDSEFEGHSIKEGEILALENGKLAFTDKDINRATLKLVKKLAKGDTSYVTLIHGADVTEDNAESMQQLISSKLNDKIEVTMINGGQPVYYYIISVE
jgi:DAK2 domain fusion protein YloV